MKYILGIDPGKKGGMAVISEKGPISVVNMPETAMDVLLTIREFKNYVVNPDDRLVCYIEKVGGIPGQGASSAFNFGKGCGWLEMCLLAFEIPTEYVTPQKWQKVYGVGSSSITKSSAAEKREHKNKLKAVAQRLFSSLGKRVTLQTCDSLLIAQYGRKQEICR